MVQIQESRIRAKAGQRAALVKLRGPVLEVTPSLESILALAYQTTDKVLVIDLSDLESSHADGLAWLERASARADSAGVRLRVVAPGGSKVRRILELVRFDRFLLLVNGLREALRFGRPSGKSAS
jgi:anti-anti-sigma regulatory factor